MNASTINNGTVNTANESLDEIRKLLSRMHLSAAIFTSVNAVCIIAANLLLVTTILTSRELRHKLRNILIISTALVDLAVGVFGCPLKIDYDVRRDWIHHCYVHITMQILIGYGELCIAMWNLVTINIDWLLRFTLESPVWFTLTQRRLLKIVLVLLPWLSLFFLLVPLIFQGLHRQFALAMWTDTFCPIWLQLWTRGFLLVFSFYVPTTIIFVVNLISAVRARRLKPDTQTASLFGIKSSEERLSRYVIINSVLVCIVLPYQIFNVLFYFKGMSVSVKRLLIMYAFSRLDDARSAVLPVLWLFLLPDLRNQMKYLLTKTSVMKKRNANSCDDKVMAYHKNDVEKFCDDADI